jgi:hypothetical protein
MPDRPAQAVRRASYESRSPSDRVNLRCGAKFRLWFGATPSMNRGVMNLEHGSILFDKTTAQCRSIGRHGGRARACNRPLRNAVQAPAVQVVIEPRDETVHEAILLLDTQFPWLAGCERPSSRCA